MGYLLVLALAVVLVAVIGFLVWSYRKQVARKAAASQERYAQLFSLSQPGAAPVQEAAAIVAPAASRQAEASIYSGNERLLSKAETLLFYILRAGLPGHEIFARVNLAAVIDISPVLRDYERDLQRRLLAQHSLDFVVCDKSTKIVAAVEFKAETETAAFKATCLESARIRHVRINAAALPRRGDMHYLVYGTHPRRDA